MNTIPTYPILYKINSNNKISEWEIKIIKKGAIYAIITTHGEKDGKKVTHEKDVEEGKAKKTILEQASQEALRKWKNKTEKELYSQTLPDLTEKSKETTTVRPMLAQTFSFDVYESKSRAFKISFPSYVQRKYDGIRCIAYMRDGNIILESRKGIPFQNFTNLKNELKELFKYLPYTFYFDGELYTDKLDFEVVSGLIRLHEDKVNSEDLKLIDKIEYHVYDFVDTNRLNLPFSERYTILNDFLKEHIKKISKVKPVETFIVNKLSDIKKYHDEFIKNGYEGIMIRDKDGIYEVNKRSKYLQKFKEFIEEEFKIVGFHEGSGDEKGAVIWDCITKGKKTFAVRPKGTFETRKKLYEDGDKYIGKLLTVIFQEYSSDEVPRFPVGKAIRDIY
jgi:DNA ligase-1